MKNFKNALNEIYFNLNSLAVFNILLDCAIIFLIAYLALSLLSIPRAYAIYPVVPYVIIALIVQLRKNRIRQVESRYAVLDEKLRTAADNMRMSNVLVDALKEDIFKNLKRVELSSFFNERALYAKCIAAMLLCFLIVYFSPVSFKHVSFSFIPENISLPKQLSRILPGNRNYIAASDTLAQANETSEGQYSIYGDESFALLGKDELYIKLQAVSKELNLRDETELNTDNFDELYPGEVSATASQTYEENIPREQQELVKRYFQYLAKEGT